ncbi:MAG: zinc-ribbon domain-containing protein [Lachnospiraceae bacterium]|nr:zinc-ribbon domain-containing protein [Lachnospiraceae bacterium]
MEVNNNSEIEKMSNTMKYCSKCGKSISTDASYCLHCGFRLDGKEEMKKSKKPKIWLIIIFVLCIGGVCGGTVYYLQQKAAQEAYEAEQKAIREAELLAEQQRQELILSYKTIAYEIYTKINKAKSNLDSISSKLISSCYLRDTYNELLGGSVMSIFDYTDSSEEERSEEKIRKDEIDRLYTELNSLKCNEAEIQEVKNVIEGLYISYCKRYDMLVELNFSESSFSEDEKENGLELFDKLFAAQDIMENLGVEENTEL